MISADKADRRVSLDAQYVGSIVPVEEGVGKGDGCAGFCIFNRGDVTERRDRGETGPFIVDASPLISHSTDPRFLSVLNISSDSNSSLSDTV